MAIKFKSGEGEELAGFEQQFKSLPFDQQRSLLMSLQTLLQESVEERRRELEAELASLDTLTGSSPKPRAQKAQVSTVPSKAKVGAKYRSKRDPNLVWSGRGLSPRWLKEEMGETNEPKESFLIQASAGEA